MSTFTTERLLTLPEVALRLSISRRTVERLIRDGALEAVAIRGSTRVEPGEVERLIDEGRRLRRR